MKRPQCIKEIDTFLDTEKQLSPQQRLRQLTLNKDLMVEQLMYLKGADLERCKWTVNNYVQQIKELKEEIKTCIQS